MPLTGMDTASNSPLPDQDSIHIFLALHCAPDALGASRRKLAYRNRFERVGSDAGQQLRGGGGEQRNIHTLFIRQIRDRLAQRGQVAAAENRPVTWLVGKVAKAPAWR